MTITISASRRALDTFVWEPNAEMITYEQGKQVVLDLVTEDFYGLWEIDWAFRTDFPELSNAEALSTARDVVRKMIDADLIAVFRRSGLDASEIKLSRDEAEKILSESKNWKPRGPYEEQIVVTSTKKGDQVYERGL